MAAGAGGARWCRGVDSGRDVERAAVTGAARRRALRRAHSSTAASSDCIGAEQSQVIAIAFWWARTSGSCAAPTAPAPPETSRLPKQPDEIALRNDAVPSPCTAGARRATRSGLGHPECSKRLSTESPRRTSTDPGWHDAGRRRPSELGARCYSLITGSRSPPGAGRTAQAMRRLQTAEARS